MNWMKLEGDIIDWWSVPHFVVPFLGALLLVPRGVSEFFLVGLAVLFELAEHTVVGKVIFGWTPRRRETALNAIMDIFLALLGIKLAGLVMLI